MFIKNNLAITREQDFDQEFGMYPVLYVNLAVGELIFHFPSQADSQAKRMSTVGHS